MFYVETTKYLINHLPIDNKLLRDVSLLHPNLRHSEHGAQAIRRLAVMMPTISQEEVALIADEWNVYMVGAVDTDDTDCAEERVDHCWANVFQEKSHQGKFKYSILQKLIKGLLSLAHGNADVERSISANKKTVTPDRASLSDVTINGLRTVEDHVKLYGEPHNVHITRDLIQATREADKAYGKKLSNEKEELLRKKAIQDGEKQRLRDREKERQQEAQKLEQRRLNLSETEKELMKSEKQKDSELQTAKTLYEEANERLTQAIQNKNFNEAAVAQGLLEVAKKKMENAMDQSKLCSKREPN